MPNNVIPAKAGIQDAHVAPQPARWIPAFAGMTCGVIVVALLLIAVGAFAGDETPGPLVCVRNRVLVPVAINDTKPHSMLLDFALPRPVLANEVVDYLKLETMPSESGDARLVTLHALQYGDKTGSSKTCLAMGLAPLSGLLGATVAGIVNPREFGSEIVLDIGRGVFAAHGMADAIILDEKDPRTVKMSMTGGRPAVPATLNGSTMRSCILDTTFGGTIAVSEALLAELGVALDATPKLVARSVPGIGDDLTGRVQIRLKSIRVGAAEVRDPLCVVEEGLKPARLGVGFLKLFRATLNFDRNLACWESENADHASDGPIIGCGLGLQSFQGGYWSVWVAIDSPADREGIAPGAELISVNGNDMSDVSYANAVAALPSEEGKEAEVTLKCNGATRIVVLRAEKLL